jgi:hypothetical protein
LDRIQRRLKSAADSATDTETAGDIGGLRKRFLGVLDQRYSNYAAARGEYATGSRAIDPFEEGQVGKALDADVKPSTDSNGNPTTRLAYSMAQERIPDTFLKSRALRSDFDGLIKAYGGDADAAKSHLQDYLVNQVKGAINPKDGTLSEDAFARAVEPYTKALNMWFPELKAKFDNARAAQTTFENVTAQKGLADDINVNKALRGDGGFVTRDKATQWINKNADTLSRTQSPAAVMRLRKIAESLPDDPGAGAQAAVEAAPMAVGGFTGGLEGSVLGGIMHKIPSALASPLLKRYYESYNQAIEKAFTDPATAQNLANKAVKFGGFRKVLGDAAKKAVVNAPTAVNAATVPGQ